MINLRNNSHGGIIRVCIGIFTAALRNKIMRQILKKSTSPYFYSVTPFIWPLTLMKRTHFRLGLSYVRWKRRNEQLAKMGSFHQSKRSDNKWYTVEVRWGIFFWEFDVFFLFLRAVVNMPIQTPIIPPWLLLRTMIISQLELGPPVGEYAYWC